MGVLHKYWVTGTGQFPDDMLRYDQAKVVRKVPRNDHATSGKYLYEIEGKCSPTVARWQSFLWIVIQSTQEKARWGIK